jgi:hypothetical protein
MKNKKAQMPFSIEQIFAAFIGIILLVNFFPILTGLFQQECPTYDCSGFQNQLAECNQKLLTPEIIYVNNTVEVPVVEEKVIYSDVPVSITEISLTLVFSLALTLFSFKIKLSKRLEKKLEENLEDLEKIIKFVKYGSLVLTILIFIKLASILITLI